MGHPTPEPSQVHVTYTAAFEKVSAAHALAEKDNSTVYNEPVPPLSSLAALAPRSIVKPVPLPELTTPLTAAEDPFVSIVPRAVKAQLEIYDARAKAIGVEAASTVDSALSAGEIAVLESSG